MLNPDRPVAPLPQPAGVPQRPTEAVPPVLKAETPAPAASPDRLELQHAAPSALADIQLFEQDGESKSGKAQDNGTGWKVKSVHLNLGYVLDNQILHTGPMRLKNAEQGTDLTLSGYEQTDRKNWEYLQIKPGQRFAPDEPQFNLGVNLGFENGFGLELDAKHNKIIMAGYEQDVHFSGTLHGEAIDETRPLNSFMAQHEQTLGNLQLSALGSYSFELPAPAQHRFSFITKAGPSLITTNTRFQVKGPDGELQGGTSGLQVAGYGASIENGLRYQLGPKAGRLGLELTHALSYLNYAKYETVNGYTGSHSALYSGLTLKATVGLHGNKK